MSRTPRARWLLAYGYPETVPNENPSETSLLDRLLAYLIAGLVLLSVASFVAVIIGTQAGAGADDGFSHGLWPSVLLFPLFALPVAFLLLVVLLVRGVNRRSRLAKGGS